jgi:predicted metal-dependent peptidase
MNIPKKIKIGGKTYKVEVTRNLDLGNAQYSGEVDYCNLVIRIFPHAQQRMEADFLHEMVHAIYDHLGYTNHDEKKVDELAQALYMVIQDNPKMFERVIHNGR